MNRDLLRKEAKRIYKEKAKGVPKANRMSFAEFFKQYKQMKMQQNAMVPQVIDEEPEDVDMEDFLNVNNLNEDEENT